MTWPLDDFMQDQLARAYAELALCPTCGHPTAGHSREAEVGCLHRNDTSQPRRFCPCLEPGTSEADQ